MPRKVSSSNHDDSFYDQEFYKKKTSKKVSNKNPFVKDSSFIRGSEKKKTAKKISKKGMEFFNQNAGQESRKQRSSYKASSYKPVPYKPRKVSSQQRVSQTRSTSARSSSVRENSSRGSSTRFASTRSTTNAIRNGYSSSFQNRARTTNIRQARVDNSQTRQKIRQTKNNNQKKSFKYKAIILAFKILIPVFCVALAVFGILYMTTEIPKVEEISAGSGTKIYFADVVSATEKNNEQNNQSKEDSQSKADSNHILSEQNNHSSTPESKTNSIDNYLVGVVGSEKNREIIDIKILPDYVKNAIIASEDRSFYSNPGVDYKSIIRAIFNNMVSENRQGASTITQQYAELVYTGQNPSPSYFDKVKEAMVAMKISKVQSKDEILNNYMNIVYFGRGAYGIEAAAKAYFGHSAKELTIKEAALLAGVIPAPSLWDPEINPKMAQERMARTLDIMISDGYVKEEDIQDKIALPKTVSGNETSGNLLGTNGYLLKMAEDELRNRYKLSDEQISSGNYRITLTVKSEAQKAILQAAKNLPKDAPKNLKIGGVSIDSKTGGILAAYCGENYKTNPLNNVTSARAQAGSTIKPFALLQAIKDGINLESDDYDGNSPLSIDGLTVTNSDDISYGKVNLYKATAYSINTAFAQLNQKIGPNSTARIARLAGIDENIPAGEIFNVLGSVGVTPLELCRAYSTFANKGVKSTPHIIEQVEVIENAGNLNSLQKTKVLDSSPLEQTEVFGSSEIEKLTEILKAPIDYGFSKKAQVLNNKNRQVAGKSGTSSDFKSGWFVGYADSITTAFGIWQTGANGEEEKITPFGANKLGQVGSGFPLDAFVEYMSKVLK